MFSSNTIAAKLSLKVCKKVSAVVNKKQLPQRVDEYSIAQNSYCTLEGEDVILNYKYTMVPVDIDWAAHKQSVVNAWCSRSDLRFLLDDIGKVAMHYYLEKGTHIKTFIFSNRYC